MGMLAAMLAAGGFLSGNGWSQDGIPPYQPLGDPIERFNRSVGYINHGIMMGIIDPTSRVYRLILPRPVRKGVNNMGENLAYPVRMVNNLFQAEFGDAWTDTKRFGVNTTVGVVGFFDPATDWGIETYREDTGRTLGKWGWDPNFYLMLPFLGPSSDRNVFGKVGDMGLNPATYLFPASPIFTYNRLSDDVLTYKELTTTQYDPYTLSRDVWAVTRMDAENLILTSPDREDPALQTLNALQLRPQRVNFVSKSKRRKVLIPSTGKKLGYNLWIQKNPSLLVYVLPGLGGHRESSASAAVAEMLFDRGYSVVSLSSPMNWEFIQKASTALTPGYPPMDSRDILVAIETIHADLTAKYPDRIRGRALLGVSLGAFHVLTIAEEEISRDDARESRFDRYIAINPPVDLIHGMQQLDAYYDTPLSWPAETRVEMMENALMKTAASAMGDQKMTDLPPLNRQEARFLIGLWYRRALTDAIHCSQFERDLGVVQSPLGKMRRDPALAEIGQYSYINYLETFVFPTLRDSYSRAPDRESILRSTNLRSREKGLVENPKVRVFANRNDFLLTEEDVAWLEGVFPQDRIEMLPDGGHMGNLYLTSVQDRICRFLQ